MKGGGGTTKRKTEVKLMKRKKKEVQKSWGGVPVFTGVVASNGGPPAQAGWGGNLYLWKTQGGGRFILEKGFFCGDRTKFGKVKLPPLPRVYSPETGAP